MRNIKYVTLTLVAVAGLGLAGATAALPQDHEQHHPPEATAQEEGSQMPAMCGAMMQQMMGEMHEHMAMMQRMMAEMHGKARGHGMGGMTHGPMADGSPGMHGPAPMRGMAMMKDPSTIEDAAVAEQQAERLEGMIERMRAHIEQLEQRVEALHGRAAELRQGDPS